MDINSDDKKHKTNMIQTLSNEIKTTQSFHQPQWTYSGDYGPDKWPLLFSSAIGKHQSPIDIKTHFSVYDRYLYLKPLSINYDNLNCCHIKNAGTSFQVTSSNGKSEVFGGPTQNIYNFLQFHMHWGPENMGSEHTIDGTQYAAELHFVNVNNKFIDFNEALNSHEKDALLVLGVFVEIGEFNYEFNKVLNSLEEVKYKNQCYTMSDKIQLKHLLPENTLNYWTYDGSLTTPPLTECVKWIVFQNTLQVSNEQLIKLRELHSCTEDSDCNDDDTKINCNYRPTCQLNDRIVCKSFEDD